MYAEHSGILTPNQTYEGISLEEIGNIRTESITPVTLKEVAEYIKTN